ncbi:peptide ABC transporter permease [Gardnerella vaginalis]|uniref:peptide ABC transporter permease n=1 Tax=Gardnerella vaginalis TaxID=2702 RepID=UPI000C7D78BD|nr:peptide ABC transporter permease [Gardnerella vaginalis]PKZ45800.1 peptide ABC transporter permease [Gardnerella vaginalis]
MVTMPVLKRKPKRKISAARRRMYIRRRIVVCVGLLVLLAFCIFCIISIFKGVSAIGTAINKHSDVTISKQLVPDPRPVGIIKKCSAKDVRIELTSASQSVPMGGSVEFTARIVHEGDDSCRIDASDGRMVLTIGDSVSADKSDKSDKSREKQEKQEKQQKIEPKWRSDVCEIPLKPLLMAKGDSYEKKIVWSTDATVGTPTGKDCLDDAELPKVSRGTYIAQIAHKDVSGLQSNPVVISVR